MVAILRCCAEARLHFLFSMFVVSEACLSSDICVSLSPVVFGWPWEFLRNRAQSIASAASICLPRVNTVVRRAGEEQSIFLPSNFRLFGSVSYDYYTYFLLFLPSSFRRNLKVSMCWNRTAALLLRELGSDELSLRELGSDELSWTANIGHGKHSGHASSVSSLFLVPRTHGEFSWLLSWEPAGILSAKLNEAELLCSLLTFSKLSFLKSFTLPSSLGEPFGVSRELCRREKITAGS